MEENLFKVFFLISYKPSFSKEIKYSLSNENGIGNLKINSTKKVKNDDDNKEYIVLAFSFDIYNPKEENKDKKNNLFKAIINFTIENDIYEEQILFKEGKNNFIYNFQIKNNPSLIILGQFSQLKLFYEVIKGQKENYRDIILNDLIPDTINFLKEIDTINFNCFLELLKLCFFDKKRNLVLLNFQFKKIKLSNNLNPKDYASILSGIEKNPAKYCNENDGKEKKEINEKFYFVLLYFIANYENDEKIKKIEKLLSDKGGYLIKNIALYTQYYPYIKKSKNNIYNIFMKVNLPYEIIKGILNYFPNNIKRLDIIYQYHDFICEFCKKNDKILKMIELAPPQKDDNLEQIIEQITLLINYQKKINLFFLSFEKEYWERYYKFNQTAERLMLINNIIIQYQNIDKNLKTIVQLNSPLKPYSNKNNNSKDIFKDFIEPEKIQKRIIMPSIGNISVGKSFFLNSIFGIDFCQVKSDITTKFILFIRHIDNLREPRLYKLEPFKKDNSYEFFYNCKEIFTGEENIKNKINQINDENNNKNEAIFYMLEIEIKSIKNKEFLNKVDFLDMPGLNESGEDYINLYFEYIKDMIKYCLIIFSVDKFNSKDSMKVIKNLKKNLYVPIENFLIILNKIDIADDLEKAIHDFKKVVLYNGSFNIYKNTIVPVDSLLLNSEIQMKNNFYHFINYYYMVYNKNRNAYENFMDFIKEMNTKQKKNLPNFNELLNRIKNINDDEIKKYFERLKEEKKDLVNIKLDGNELKHFKLFYILFKEKLLIPEVSKPINDINNYFNNIKNYDFPNKNFEDNNNKEKESIYDNSEEHEILKDLDKFFEETFISEKLKNYANIIPILKDDFKILKNYIFNSSLNYIPILGSSNSGKSSFINCLLGKNILHCDSSECTKRAIIVRYLEDKEKTSLYSIKFKSSENLNDIYYYYTKKELISENLEEIKEILSIFNEDFPTKEKDSFLLLEINIKFLENSKVIKKSDICFVDFPGHNTFNNSFFNNQIYQKVLKMSSFFIYINSGKAFKEDSNKMLLSTIYNEAINIRKSDINSKQFIELCLFIFNKVDLLEEKERELNNINKQIKETLELQGNDVKINCSFFSSKLYKEYLSKIEEYKISEIIKLFKKYLSQFKSQEKDIFNEKEKKETSFIKFVEDKLEINFKSNLCIEDIDLNKINKEKITSSDFYKQISTFLDKFYEENNLNKEEELKENYNEKLQNICKYLILCNENNTKFNLYKQSYASSTFKIIIENIVKSHHLKKVEYNNHLERFLIYLNIFFGMEERFTTIIVKRNLDQLVQISLNNVNKFFQDFKGKELIEHCQKKILDFIEKQKESFQNLMEKNNNDVNKIIEYLENKINYEKNHFKDCLNNELNKLEKNIRDELSKIGTEMISINKNVSNPLPVKDKLLVTFSVFTLGIGMVFYGLFYKLPNLIINAIKEERKFKKCLEEIAENIINEFQNIKDSIENNIKSYHKIVTKNIKRFYGVIQAGKIKNDENWKEAKVKYIEIYNKYKKLKSKENIFLEFENNLK